MSNDQAKVAVGMSGGVDSSVAAALLKNRGYDVIGITMEIFDGSVAVKESHKHACYGPGEKEDVEKAASVCRQIGMPFHVIDLKKEYKKRRKLSYRSARSQAGALSMAACCVGDNSSLGSTIARF